MNKPLTLEFEESEVRDAAMDGDVLRLRFAAAAVRTAAGERGWLRGVTLTLAGAASPGDRSHAFGRLAEGSVRVAGQRITALPLPCSLAGPHELALRFASGALLEARGGTLALTLAEGATTTPDLSC